MPIRIHSLSTTSGFLEHSSISFAVGLTCIIGARGTCKSTIVESIRFAFDCGADRISRLVADSDRRSTHETGSVGMIRATLRAGTVRCDIVETTSEGDAVSLTLEREIDTHPRIYRERIKEHLDASLLTKVEIYSQGDLQQIAEHDLLRLELIDRPNKAQIEELRRQREEAAQELRRIGPELKNIRAAVETRRTELRGLQELESQLSQVQQLRPQLSAELDSHHNEYLRRKTTLEQLRHAVTLRGRMLSMSLSAVSARTDFDRTVQQLRASGAEHIENSLSEFAETTRTFDDLCRQLEVRQAVDVATLVAHIGEQFEQSNATYYRLRREEQAVSENLRQEDALKHQIAGLQRVQKDMEGLSRRQETAVARRLALRRALQEIGEQIYELRLNEADEINRQHGGIIQLTLEAGAQSVEYAAKIASLLQGSRIRTQEEVARELASRLAPAELVDLVEDSDARRLASLLGRDHAQMARVVTHLMDHPGLHELEGIVFEDRLEITMFDRGVAKPVNELSKGQKATALLPLILRDADYPLIFDQPEDDLDNSFIYNTLVDRIRDLKKRRQVIFVTHNANIPVLGEADRVIVMRMSSPISADAPSTGTVEERKEDILTFLEGGADAFRRRHERYAALLER